MTLGFARGWVAAGVAAALFIAGYAAGTCGKPTSDQLDQAHETTKAAVERAETAESAREAVEIQARAEIRTFQASRDSALAVVNQAGNRRTTVVERVVERAGPDSAAVRLAVEEVVDSIVVNEIRPLRLALALSDSVGASQGRMLASEREARLSVNEALHEALAEVDGLRDARPSWLSRNAAKMALPLAVVGGWYLRGLVHGTGSP